MRKPQSSPKPAAAPTTASIRYDHGDAFLDGQRITYDTEAPESALVVGRDLEQVGFSGLSSTAGKVYVGPAHPLYVAVNVAFQRGAKSVEISDAPEETKARLSPWFEAVADRIEVQFT